MKRTLSVFAMVVSAALGLGTVAPAMAAGPAGIAAPATVGQAQPGADMVQTVDHRRYHRRHRDRHYGRHHRPRQHYRGPSFSFQFGSPGYYHAPRYRVAPRYRAAPRSHYRASNAHVRWCNSRYRSYRAWDNTWQPYHGPRRQCFSPYS